MEFKEFIASFTGNFNDTNLILTSFTKVVSDDIDVIQRRQLEVLLRHYNFIESIYISFTSSKTNGAKEIFNEIDKISKTFDAAQIPAQIYAYFCYAVLKAVAPNFPSGEVKWIDPRKFDLVNMAQISGSNTFGTGAFNETLNDFVIQNDEIVNVKVDREIITVPYGVKKLSANAFRGLKKVRIISIPNSVSDIPNNLFSELATLESVFLPDSINVIPSGTFKKCRNLKTVIAKGVKEIGDYAFEETQVASFRRFGDKNIKNIGSYAFKNCNRLQILDLDGVSIGFGAFIGCTNLAMVKISVSDELKSIAEVFCENVEKSAELKIGELYIGFDNGVIPESFFSKLMVKSIKLITPIKEIGAKAFGGCEKLEIIEGEFNVNSIKESAFKGCLSLQKLPVFKGVNYIGNQAFNYCKKITSLEFKGDVSFIGDGAFANCEELVDLKINYVGTTFPKFCFANSPKVDVSNFVSNIEVLESNSFSKIKVDKYFKFWPKLKCVKENAFDECVSEVEVLEVPNNVVFEKMSLKGLKPIHLFLRNSEIKDASSQLVAPYNLFSSTVEEFIKEQTQLKYISIEKGNLSNMMFASWTSIEKVHFGKDIRIIPVSCFENCTNLELVKLDSDVVHFLKRAFYNCTKLNQLIVNNKNIIENGKLDLSSVDSLEENALYGCSAIKEVVARKFKLKPLAFQEFKSIEHISLEIDNSNSGINFIKLFASDEKSFNNNFSSLKTVELIVNGVIPDSFFENCNNIKEINVVGDVKVIHDSAFKNCWNLEKLTMNFIGEEIPSHCFYRCHNLTEISLPNVKEVGESAFENCDKLVKLTLSSQVNRISNYAFKGCVALNKLPFTLDANSIGDEAFMGMNQLSEINLSNVDRIGTGVFSNCSNIEVIRLSNIHTLSKLLFQGCYKVRGVDLQFADDYQSDVVFSELFEEDAEVFNNKYPNLTTIDLKASGQIPAHFFLDNRQIKKIEVEGQISSLGEAAFKGCHNLVELTLDYIGDVIPPYCFYDCHSFVGPLSFTSINKISNNAFENCALLENIEFDELSEEVGDYAFKNCCKLKAIPSKMCPRIFGVESFFGCKEIKELTLVANNLEIREKAFYDIPNFDKIEIQPLGNELSLKDIVNPDADIKEISFLNQEVPASFFQDMVNLHKVNLVDNEVRLGACSFKGCSSLNEITNLDKVVFFGNESLSDTAFTTLVISKDTKYMGLSVFKGCSKLKELTLPLIRGTLGALFSSYKFENSKEITHHIYDLVKTYYIPKDLKRITINNLNNEGVEGALSGLDMNEIVIDCKITDIPISLFHSSKGLITFNYFEDISVINAYAFAETDFGDIDFPDVTEIGDYAFKNCKNIKKAKLGEELNVLSSTAFDGVPLEKLEIVNNPLFVNEYGFTINKGTKEVVFVDKDIEGDIIIPEEINVIQSSLLSNHNKITSIDLNRVNVIEDESFLNCTSLRKVLMSKEVKEIGKNIFKGVKSLDELVITFIGKNPQEPASLSYLNEDEMNIKKLVILDGDIVSGFVSKHKFEVLDLSSVKNLSLKANSFVDCQIDELILPRGTKLTCPGVFISTRIGLFNSDIPHDEHFIYFDNTIYLCYNPVGVKEVKIDENLSKLTPQSFEGIKKLDKVEILIKNAKLEGAFNDIEIKELVLEENKLSSLDEEFLGSKNSLLSFTYQGNKLHSNFLKGYSSLRELILNKLTRYELELDVKLLDFLSLLSLEKIDKHISNVKYRHLLIGNKVEEIDYDAYIAIKADKFEIGKNEFFIVDKGMHIDVKKKTIYGTDKSCKGDIIIPDNITRIYKNAFNGREITSLDTNKVEEIGDQAFANIKTLNDIIIRNKVQTFGKEIFTNSIATKLMYPKLPIGYKTLEQFFGKSIISNLEKIVVTDEEIYENRYFYGCDIVKEIVLSHHTLELHSDCFMNCEYLDNLIIPERVQVIEKFAFRNCFAIKPVPGKNKAVKTAITIIFKDMSLIAKFSSVKGYDFVAVGLFKKVLAKITCDGWKETEYEL